MLSLSSWISFYRPANYQNPLRFSLYHLHCTYWALHSSYITTNFGNVERCICLFTYAFLWVQKANHHFGIIGSIPIGICWVGAFVGYYIAFPNMFTIFSPLFLVPWKVLILVHGFLAIFLSLFGAILCMPGPIQDLF